MWFIGVEVEQEKSAPPPKKKNPRSVPELVLDLYHKMHDLYDFEKFVSSMAP